MEQGLVFQRPWASGCQNGPETITPSARKWQNFYKKLVEARVQKWKRYYDEPNILDGTQWEFRLTTADLKIETGGSNAYPPNEQWGLLLRALRNLTGKQIR